MSHARKPPRGPAKRGTPAIPEPVGDEPEHLLTPKHATHVWHMDQTHIRILWFSFTLAAILDGFSRKLLAFKGYAKRPRTCDMMRLVQVTARKFGTPRFLITDHGMQFGKRFREHLGVRGRE